MEARENSYLGPISRRDLLARMGVVLAGGVAAPAQAQKEQKVEGKTPPIEHLGQPCRARNVHTGLVLKDAGREWFVITNTNESANVELIFIDAATDTAEVHRAPAGAGAWALHRLPQERLALGTYYDGMFLIFDVPGRRWIKTVKFPGEDYIWTLATGSDGRIYGGTYPGGKLGALDPDDYAFEDLGAPSAGNMYLRYTSSLPDGRIFCQFGFHNTETKIFDPATKQFSPAPEHMQAVTHGVSWNGYFLAARTAYRMPDLKQVDPLPFPAPDPAKGQWAVDLRLTDRDTLILRQGPAVLQYRAGEAAPRQVLAVPSSGGALMARNEQGVFFCIRGQDYFVLKPGQQEANLKIIPGEAAPRDTHFLHIDDHGLLWGGPTFGQTLFYLDTKTGKVTNTRTVSDHGGEVYDVATLDGVCYAVSYAGGEIIRFNPAEPWDQIGDKNPRTIAKVGPDYIRPSAGVTLGADGRLYSGWLAKYGVYGGLLTITEPATGKTETFKDPLGPHGLSGLAVLDKGLLLLGTTTYGNGLGNQKDVSAKVGVWDVAAGKAAGIHEIAGAASAGSMAYQPQSNLAAFIAGGKLFLYDVAGRRLARDGAPVVDEVNGGCVAWKDGKFLYGQGQALYSLSPITAESPKVAEAPARIDKLTFGGPDNAIFIACGVDVYRVRV